jgi:hypothetical protein
MSPPGEIPYAAKVDLDTPAVEQTCLHVCLLIAHLFFGT